MPSTMQFSLLALASTAAAIPHYSHSRFHKPSGYGTGSPYPTGGFNGTAPHPTGTGAGYGDHKTTTVLETEYSTATVVSTVYAQKPSGGQGGAAPSSVAAADASKPAGACGPETVYVTATNKVTVTVGGGAPSSAAYSPSSAAQAVSSGPASSAPAASVPAGGYGVSISFVLPSSVGEARVSHAQSSAAASSIAYSAAVPVVSSAAPVVSSAPAVTPTPSATPAEAASSSAVVVSSAAASQSATPYSGGKRGLAYAKADLGLCSGLTAAWAYNWESVPSSGSGSLPSGVTFYPTMHGPNFITTTQWFSDVETAVSGGASVVFGFNEPDIAGVSVADACTAWGSYMNPIKEKHSGVTVVGPSVSNSNLANQGLTWLKSFQDSCTSATWDAANIHFYWTWEENLVEKLQAQVEAAAKQTGKKVWVTEFGLSDTVATEAQAASFLSDCMKYLEGSADVAGYSYFKVGSAQYNLNSGSSGLVTAYSS